MRISTPAQWLSLEYKSTNLGAFGRYSVVGLDHMQLKELFDAADRFIQKRLKQIQWRVERGQ
jgi:hypothetical protein